MAASPIHRRRGGSCELRTAMVDDADIYFGVEPRRPWYVPGYDPLTRILQSVEEL